MTIVEAADEKREWSQEELRDEARHRFGDDPKMWAFVCPACGDVATVQDFIDAGDANAAKAGQECIGRSLGALGRDAKRDRKGIMRAPGGRGCDWAAYGLFHGPWAITLPAEGDKAERVVHSFALAPGGKQ
jgi:hypothetical protein